MPDDDDRQTRAPSEVARRYCLRTYGPSHVIEISADEFHAIKQAMNNLFILLDTEEKFGMIIYNFLEYERELLSLALEDMALRGAEWSKMRGALALVNRRLANVLTVARLYLDHIKHDVAAMYGGTGEQLTRITRATNTQYDSRLGYRVMEALRNVLQHRSFPIKIMNWCKDREERADECFLRHRVTAHLRLTDLERNEKFKKSVLEELRRRREDQIDVGPLLREYIEGLSLVHMDVRLASDEDMQQWLSVVMKPAARYAEVSGRDPDTIVAYALDDEQFALDEVPIVRDGIDELRQWRDRLLPTRISKSFVSDGPE